MAPSPTSSPSSSSSPYKNNTVDYTLDHTRAHDPSKPDSAGELTLSANSKDEAQDAMRSCALQILEQPLEMLAGGIVGDEEFSAVSRSVSGSTVGKHLRHVLDHFRLFLDQVEESCSTPSSSAPTVDYDRRARSVSLESSVRAAHDEFQSTRDRVSKFLSTTSSNNSNTNLLDRPVVLQATTPILQEFRSTIGRELWFICLHAIHHFALARVILNELGVQEGVSKEFGVAPSTLIYREWGRQQSQSQSQSQSPRAKL